MFVLLCQSEFNGRYAISYIHCIVNLKPQMSLEVTVHALLPEVFTYFIKFLSP